MVRDSEKAAEVKGGEGSAVYRSRARAHEGKCFYPSPPFTIAEKTEAELEAEADAFLEDLMRRWKAKRSKPYEKRPARKKNLPNGPEPLTLLRR